MCVLCMSDTFSDTVVDKGKYMGECMHPRGVENYNTHTPARFQRVSQSASQTTLRVHNTL